MTTPNPSVGRIVHMMVSPLTNNGADVAPAIITRVNEDDTVNLQVFLDSTATAWYTGVPILETRPETYEHAAFWPSLS